MDFAEPGSCRNIAVVEPGGVGLQTDGNNEKRAMFGWRGSLRVEVAVQMQHLSHGRSF